MKKRNNFYLIGGIILILIAIGIAFYIYSYKPQPIANLNDFAKCLKDNGAVFYGAFWCPHCADQKKIFSNAKDLLPYVECSTPDSQSQTQICIDKKIDYYPTWTFKDGSNHVGVMALSDLAQKTGCQLPK